VILALVASLYGVALSTGILVMIVAAAIGFTGSNFGEFYASAVPRFATGGEVRAVTILGYAAFFLYIVFAAIVAVSARRRWMLRLYYN